MKQILLLLALLYFSATSIAQIPNDTAQLRQFINEWLVTNGSKQITATKINHLFNGVANLMKAYAIDSARISHDTIFLLRKGGYPAIPIKLPGLEGSELDPTVPLAVKGIDSEDISYWNGKQEAFGTGSGVYFEGGILKVRKDSALFNANKLNGNPVPKIDPTNGQQLTWDGTSWVPGDPGGITGDYLPLTFTGNNTVTNGTYDFSITGSSGSNLFAKINAGVEETRIGQNSNMAYMNYRNLATGNRKSIEFSGSRTGIYVLDQVNSLGMFYAANYGSVGKTNDRWLPDIKAVRDEIRDSIIAHPGGGGGGSGVTKTDSIHISRSFYNNILLPLNYGSGVIGFGHSIMVGSASSVVDSSFISRINNFIGGPLTNYGNGGASSNYVMYLLNHNYLPKTNVQLRAYMGGINDIRIQYQGYGTLNRLRHEALVFGCMANYDTIIPASGMTETGTWAGASLDTAFTFRTVGRQTSTLSSKTQFSCPSDNFFVVFQTRKNPNILSDSVQIKAGGVIVGTVNLSGQSDTTSPFIFFMPRTPYLNSGGIVAPYSVEVINLRSGKLMQIDYAGWMRPKAQQTPALIFEITRVSDSSLLPVYSVPSTVTQQLWDTANRLINRAIDSVFTKFGHKVGMAFCNDDFNAETDTQYPSVTYPGADGIHPNDRGHAKIAASAFRRLQLIPLSSGVTSSGNELLDGTNTTFHLNETEKSFTTSIAASSNIKVFVAKYDNDYSNGIKTVLSGTPSSQKITLFNKNQGIETDDFIVFGDSTIKALAYLMAGNSISVNLPSARGRKGRAQLDINGLNPTIIMGSNSDEDFYHSITNEFSGMDGSGNKMKFRVNKGNGDSADYSTPLILDGAGNVFIENVDSMGIAPHSLYVSGHKIVKGSVGGINVYNSNGILSSARTMTLGSHDLSFLENGAGLFRIKGLVPYLIFENSADNRFQNAIINEYDGGSPAGNKMKFRISQGTGDSTDYTDALAVDGAGNAYLGNADSAGVAPHALYYGPGGKVMKGAIGNNDGGTYTPSFTVSTANNMNTYSGYTYRWHRIKNEVFVEGAALIAAYTGTGNTSFNISLPIPSNLTSAINDLSGSGQSTTVSFSNVTVEGDITNDEATVNLNTLIASGTGVIKFSFSYTIK